MSARIRYLVGPYNGRWLARCGDRAFGTFDTRAEAVRAAAARARKRWREHGELAELRVQRRDGTIGETRTYGRDPRRTPG